MAWSNEQDLFLRWLSGVVSGLFIGLGILTPGWNLFYLVGIVGMFLSAAANDVV